MAQRNGLYWPGYGALTQGAFNAFYERELLGNPAHKVRKCLGLGEGCMPLPLRTLRFPTTTD